MRHYTKALVLWRRTLQCLDPLVPHGNFMKDHVQAEKMTIRGGDGNPLGVVHFSEADEASDAASVSLRRRFPAGVFIPQHETERILTTALRSRGVEVEWGTTLTALDAQDHRDVVVCLLDKVREYC